MIQDFETLIKRANAEIRSANDTQPEYALIHSNLAISIAVIAVAHELKKFNDEAEVERQRIEHNLERADRLEY